MHQISDEEYFKQIWNFVKVIFYMSVPTNVMYYERIL
jgi:hypothetical protein